MPGVLAARGMAADRWGWVASLTAEAGVAIFRIAVDRWVERAIQQSPPHLVRDSLGQLKAVTAGR